MNGTPASPSVNLDTGSVVFSAPVASAAEIRWTGVFDLWVRFNQDWLPFSLDNLDATNGTVDLIEDAPPPEGSS